MTAHVIRRGPAAKGSAVTNTLGHKLSPRIAASFDSDDFTRLAEIADERQVPVASVVRDAVKAYLVRAA